MCQGQLMETNLAQWLEFVRSTKLWSDGYHDREHDARCPAVVSSCPLCSAIFWVADAQEVGDVPEPEYFDEVVEVKRALWFGTKKVKRSGRRDSELASMPMIQHADVAGISTALDPDCPLKTSPRREYARTRLWWAFDGDRSRMP